MHILILSLNHSLTVMVSYTYYYSIHNNTLCTCTMKHTLLAHLAWKSWAMYHREGSGYNERAQRLMRHKSYNNSNSNYDTL